MDDAEIIRLFFARSENAIKESRLKYGALCRSLAMRVLGSREDAEETENDTYLRAWNTIPPTSPSSLGAYLAAVCRRLSIDRLRAAKSKKRGGGTYETSLAELDDTVADVSADFADAAALSDLRRITDRYVEAEIDRLLADHAASGGKYAAVDAINVLDTGLAEYARAVVGITAPEEERVKRLMAREGISAEYARLRIRAQKPNAYFENNCTYTVANDGTEEEFRRRCDVLFKSILEENDHG